MNLLVASNSEITKSPYIQKMTWKSLKKKKNTQEFQFAVKTGNITSLEKC